MYDGDLSDDEFMMLYDLNKSRDDYSYWSYVHNLHPSKPRRAYPMTWRFLLCSNDIGMTGELNPLYTVSHLVFHSTKIVWLLLLSSYFFMPSLFVYYVQRWKQFLF